MKRKNLNLLVGLLLLIIFGLLLFVFQVRRSEVVLITTFGKPTRTVDQPGAYVKLPWPVQRVHRFDRRIQNFEDKFDEGLTGDSYNLMTQLYIGWKISDPEAFYPKFPTEDSIQQAQATLQGLVRSAKSAIIGKHPLSDFVSTDVTQLKFAEIEKETMDQVQAQLSNNNYGIQIEFLGIKKLGLPDSVVQEVFKLMQSDRKVLVSATTSDGDREASNIRSAAESESVQLLAKANAEALSINAEAQAKAAESFAVFERNPDLAKFLITLKAFEMSLTNRSTLIFDQHTVPFNLFQGYTTNVGIQK